MADLYGQVFSDKTSTKTAAGVRQMTASIRSWDAGVTLEALKNKSDELVISVYVDGGSHNTQQRKLIARVIETKKGTVVELEMQHE